MPPPYFLARSTFDSGKTATVPLQRKKLYIHTYEVITVWETTLFLLLSGFRRRHLRRQSEWLLRPFSASGLFQLKVKTIVASSCSSVSFKTNYVLISFLYGRYVTSKMFCSLLHDRDVIATLPSNFRRWHTNKLIINKYTAMLVFDLRRF